jgi:hypothetical protein
VERDLLLSSPYLEVTYEKKSVAEVYQDLMIGYVKITRSSLDLLAEVRWDRWWSDEGLPSWVPSFDVGPLYRKNSVARQCRHSQFNAYNGEDARASTRSSYMLGL